MLQLTKPSDWTISKTAVFRCFCKNSAPQAMTWSASGAAFGCWQETTESHFVRKRPPAFASSLGVCFNCNLRFWRPLFRRQGSDQHQIKDLGCLLLPLNYSPVWRRREDLNLRYDTIVQQFSKLPPSTTQPLLLYGGKGEIRTHSDRSRQFYRLLQLTNFAAFPLDIQLCTIIATIHTSSLLCN